MLSKVLKTTKKEERIIFLIRRFWHFTLDFPGFNSYSYPHPLVLSRFHLPFHFSFVSLYFIFFLMKILKIVFFRRSTKKHYQTVRSNELSLRAVGYEVVFVTYIIPGPFIYNKQNCYL